MRLASKIAAAFVVASLVPLAWQKYEAYQVSKPINIHLATASSGASAPYDIPAANSVQVWADKVNAEGGLLGRKIYVSHKDTGSDPRKAIESVNEFGPKADLVFVSCDFDFGSDAARAAGALGKLVFFLCGEEPPAMLKSAGEHTFSSGISAYSQSAAALEWAVENRNVKRVFLLQDDRTEYARNLCEGFKRTIENRKLELVGTASFNNSELDFSTQLEAIRGKKPDAVLVCSMLPGLANALEALTLFDAPWYVITGSRASSSALFDVLPYNAKIIMTDQAPYYDPSTDELKSFRDSYFNFTDVQPSTSYVYTPYVGLQLWASAVKAAGTTDSGPVRAELETATLTKTILGPRRYDFELHGFSDAEFYITGQSPTGPVRIGTWKLKNAVTTQELRDVFIKKEK